MPRHKRLFGDPSSRPKKTPVSPQSKRKQARSLPPSSSVHDETSMVDRGPSIGPSEALLDIAIKPKSSYRANSPDVMSEASQGSNGSSEMDTDDDLVGDQGFVINGQPSRRLVTDGIKHPARWREGSSTGLKLKGGLLKSNDMDEVRESHHNVAENDVQVTTPQKLPLSQSSCLLSLPNELLLQIGQYLQEPDLNSLCRTNRQLYILLTHILYRKGKEIEFLDGSTLLHWACERGLTNTVHHLLDEGANPNAKYNRAPHPLQSDGRTPLHIAAEGGHRAITKHLLAKAAKTKVWDKHGNTALHIAVQNGYRRIIKLLVTSGSANINARNIEGLRPLHIAILHGQRYALKLLLSLGAKATATDTIGGSALHLAASFDTSGVCEALIDAGADPNVQDRAGMTPLHWAAYSGYESTARLLVHLGARATERDFDGKLPQHLAFGNNQSTYLYLQQLTTTTQGNVRKKESVDGSSSLSPECVPLGEMLFRTATRLKASGVDIEDAVVGTINGGASGMEQVGYDDLVL